AGRWGDLAALLQRTADRAPTPEARAELLCDLGEVQAERLGEVNAAIASYRAALDVDPQRARARAGLQGLVEADAAHRGAAPAVLLEVYAKADEWRPALALTEHRLASAPDADARVGILREAARTAETRARDLDATFGFTRRAFVQAPWNEELGADLMRLAE